MVSEEPQETSSLPPFAPPGTFTNRSTYPLRSLTS